MKAKLTKSAIDAAKPSSKTTIVWDDTLPGFGLKVTPAGKKQYILQYRMGGRGHSTKRYTIGQHGPLTPDQARKAAMDLKAGIAKGIDPQAEKQAARQKAATKEKTFGDFAETYIKRECGKLARGDEIEAIIRREILPEWKARLPGDLRKRDAIELTDRLVDAGKPAAAHKVNEIIKRLGNWLVERDILEASPFSSLKPPAPKVIRERALSDEEIKAVWQASGQIGYPFGPFVKLLLLTGQRRNEVAEMAWNEIDLDAGEWVIPSERSKNRRPHLVPLSTQAVDILSAAPRFEGPFVLTSSAGERPISGFSKTKSRLDELSEVEGWRFHDLRRTARTGLSRLGIPEAVAERVLNHTPSVLVKTYDVHSYAMEKKAALQKWADHIDRILTPLPANVVPLKGAAL